MTPWPTSKAANNVKSSDFLGNVTYICLMMIKLINSCISTVPTRMQKPVCQGDIFFIFLFGIVCGPFKKFEICKYKKLPEIGKAKSNVFHHHFYLPELNIQVQIGHKQASSMQ